MKKNYIGRTLQYEMQRSGIKQAELSSLCAISQPSISALISSDVRAAPQSLAALTHCWPSAAANGRVLIAHLRDEIKRAGHDPENAVEMRWPDGKTVTTMAERSLHVIQRHLADPDVAALVHDLATLLNRADKNKQNQHAAPTSSGTAKIDYAAEPPAPEYI